MKRQMRSSATIGRASTMARSTRARSTCGQCERLRALRGSSASARTRAGSACAVVDIPSAGLAPGRSNSTCMKGETMLSETVVVSA